MEMTLLQMSLKTNKTPERELCDYWKSNGEEQAWQVSGFTEAGKPRAIRMSQSLSGESALESVKTQTRSLGVQQTLVNAWWAGWH